MNTAISKQGQVQLIPASGAENGAGTVDMTLTPLMAAIHLASEKGNVDVMAKLLEMQERWDATQARKAFEVAFAAFKAEAPRLEKTKEVSFGTTNYKFTPLDHIANELGPLLAKHGLSYNWKQESAEAITVICVLRHAQGHSIENQLSAGKDTSGSKNGIQAIGSTVTYLRRYTLLGVLGMATSDEDTDGVTMGNALDFKASIESATDVEELERNYKEAIREGLKAKDPNALKLFMALKDKRARELAQRRESGE